MFIRSYIAVIVSLIFTFSKISYAENFIDLLPNPKSKYHPEPTNFNITLETDISAIKHAIEMLARPEFNKYPYLSVEDKEKGIYKYVEPETRFEILVTIPNLRLIKDLKIFPLGEHEFGYPMRQTYVVLRKKQIIDSSYKDQLQYYINLAYVRPQGKLSILVEWSIINPNMFNKNRFDEIMCRGKECKIRNIIFGTCKIVSNKECPEHSKQTNSSILSKWTWKVNLGDSNVSKDAEAKNHKAVPKHSNTTKTKPDTSKETETIPNPEETVRQRREQKAPKPEAEKVPNSIDLLMLKRSDQEVEIGEGHYANSLLDVRQVKTYEFENVLESECIHCEKIGEFFDDFEEESDFSKILGNAIKKMPSLNYQRKDDFILENRPKIPFMGYGHCNFSMDADKINKLIQSHEIEDLSGFVHGTLKLGCDEEWDDRIRATYTRFKMLGTSDDHFSIDMSPMSLFPKYKILTPKEFEIQVTALVLTQYTRLYREEVAHLPIEKGSEDNGVTKRTEFLTKLILRLIEAFNKRFSQHLVKGLRLVLRLVEDKFISSLLQEDKNQDKEAFSHDKYQIMALKEFILYGLGPSLKSRTGIEDSFRSFYTLNENRIRSLVQAYE